MSQKKHAIAVLLIVLSALVLVQCSKPSAPEASLRKVTFGISPFQDTLVPIVGREKGWYKEEGLDVDFKILEWTAVMESLSCGHIDVAINNVSSVVGTHAKDPNIIYYYGLNPF